MDKALRPAFLADPAARAVVEALERAGGADAARFVGGCVRDAVLARPPGDVDIATPLPPAAVTAALEGAGLRALPTGVEHGTVTALAGGRPFEITTLRRDVRTDGRRAVVAFTSDWAEDAARRDFTLNALYLSPEGKLFDPTGEGLADARAGRIRFVGDPATRIAEDYLRILRFFRFLAWFGRGEPDAAALRACADGRAGLRSLSAERVARELLKLLAAEDPRPALAAMADAGVLAEILPDGADADRLARLVAVDLDLFAEPDPVLRLAALLPPSPSAARAAARRLRLSRAEEERLAAAAEPDPALVSWMSPREIRRALYRLGPAAYRDRIRLAWAANPRPAAFAQWRMLLAYADAWTPPALPLTGEEILAAGVPEGPLVGRVRREVETFWIDLDFTDDRLALLERLKAVAQGLAYD